MHYPGRACQSQNGLAKTILQYLHINIINGQRTLNRHIYIPFLKSIDVKYYQINPRYKGMCDGCDDNAIIISEEHYNEFIEWIKNNVNNITKEYLAFQDKAAINCSTKNKRKKHNKNATEVREYLESTD